MNKRKRKPEISVKARQSAGRWALETEREVEAIARNMLLYPYPVPTLTDVFMAGGYGELYLCPACHVRLPKMEAVRNLALELTRHTARLATMAARLHVESLRAPKKRGRR